MKRFISGVLCATLVFSLALSALAISGRMTIEVDPINIQVNGETFVPTDVNGKEVPVFAYQGTSYAPVRALAEAYGLEVGYDAATNMATVTDPEAKPEQPTAPDTPAKADYSDWSAADEAAYQEFKGMWDVEITETNGGLPFNVASIVCQQNTIDTLTAFLDIHQPSEIDSYSIKMVQEILHTSPNTRAIFKVSTATSYDVLWHCYPDGVTWYCGYSDATEYVAKTLSKSGM